MRLVVFFLTVLLSSPAFSKIIWSGLNDFQNISEQIYFLEDEKGELNIGQINSGKYDSAFVLSDKPLLNFGFKESIYWLRFTLVNNKSDSLLLALEHAFIPQADLYYQLQDGSWYSIKSGYEENLNDKIIKDHYQIFPLPAGNKDFYVRIVPYMHPIVVKVWEKNAYQLQVNKQRMIYGFYVGMLSFAITINIFLFFALKRIYYLLYSILVFLYITASAGVMEGYMIYFFQEADLMYCYTIIPVLNMPALLFYCISFLEIKKATPMMYRITFCTCLFLILYIICLHLLHPLPVQISILNYILALAVFILTICIGVIIGKKGNKLGYYFAVTYSIWFILLCFELIYIQFGMPAHIFELSYVSIAIFIEAFVLAFLLAKRFQWERNADEQAKFQMQRNIVEIKQRFQQEIMQAQLEVQEQTFLTISQEIHDNIGQILSLIRLNISTIKSNNNTSAQQKIATSKELLDKAIDDLRNLSKRLNTEFVTKENLSESLQFQLNLIQKAGLYATKLEIYGDEKLLDSKKKLIVFRIAQEALNNIIKHAYAKRIWVELSYLPEKIILSIKDDGIGFEVGSLFDQDISQKGTGTHNMYYRAKLIGAEFIIKSKLGKGTVAQLTLPINTNTNI